MAIVIGNIDAETIAWSFFSSEDLSDACIGGFACLHVNSDFPVLWTPPDKQK